jgi:hypothetical protein
MNGVGLGPTLLCMWAASAFLLCFEAFAELSPQQGGDSAEVVVHLSGYLHLADEIPAPVSPRSRRRCGQAIRQSIGLMHTGHDALQVARPEDIARSCASRAEQGSKRSEINRQPFPKV